MAATDAVVAIASLVLIAAVLHDAFEVMLLPRRIKSPMRIVRFFFKVTWTFWSAIGARLRSIDRRHDFLGLYGPLSLVVLIVVWAVGLITGFGSLFWALSPTQFGSHPWLNQTYFSGVTFFTLGYGDVVPHVALAKALAVFEAGTGLGFIAMVIGYLPVMYQLFSRREAYVIMLDSLAGSPPAATTLISRYAEGRSLDALDNLLQNWQHWCAELLESQLSYPMLAYYRSQHDNQSWLAALTAIMDTCVLIMVGLHGVRTLQARLTFATARLAVVEMGRALGVRPQSQEHDRLPPTQFQALKETFATAELIFLQEDEAEATLLSFRNTYEPFLNGLADHLVISLPDFYASPEQMDNWVNSPRGRSAKRLLDSVVADPEENKSSTNN